MTEGNDFQRRLSRVEQRVEDLDVMVKALAPSAARIEVLAFQMEHFQEGQTALRSEVLGLRNIIETDKDQAVKAQRDVRLAIWALVAVIMAAVISGGAAIWAASIS